jgi:hypothetical protein
VRVVHDVALKTDIVETETASECTQLFLRKPVDNIACVFHNVGNAE